jgi:hypothetical protein
MGAEFARSVNCSSTYLRTADRTESTGKQDKSELPIGEPNSIFDLRNSWNPTHRDHAHEQEHREK